MMHLSIHGMRFDIAAFSEQGPRVENQDAYTVDSFERTALLALADGMGGEKSGSIAAKLALDTLLARAPFRTVEEARRGVREADRALAARAAEQPEFHGGMGCALGLLAFLDGADGPGWIAAHVGDVRILSRSPDGLIRLETRDHTPAFSRWEAGEISLDEIPDSAGANRLQRAVGRGGTPDLVWLPAHANWSWLILSDGVYKAMRLDELNHAMGAESALATCDAIRRKVEERGADDNYTAIQVRILTGPGVTGASAARRSTMTTPGTPEGGLRPTGEAHPSHGRRNSSWPSLLLSAVALLLALAALALAGGAAGRGDQAREIEELRSELEALQIQINEVRDPFGPAAPPLVPGTRNSAPDRVP